MTRPDNNPPDTRGDKYPNASGMAVESIQVPGCDLSMADTLARAIARRMETTMAPVAV